MRNHYFTSYAGNKRNEIKDVLPYINLDNITTIIEPFAGSAAMSYYISTQHPKKFKYILNDNNKYNYMMFLVSKEPTLTQQFNENINKIIEEFNTYTEDAPRKIYYNSICKMNTLEAYIFTHKYYSIRTGLYPMMTRFKNIKPYKLEDYPIYEFYNNEDIIYENIDGIEFLNKYNDGDNKLFLLDPPYLMACNDFYNNSDCNIYEWTLNNEALLLNSKNKFIFVLENIWIIKMLLKRFKILYEYNKYYHTSKRTTTHIIYEN